MKQSKLLYLILGTLLLLLKRRGRNVEDGSIDQTKPRRLQHEQIVKDHAHVNDSHPPDAIVSEMQWRADQRTNWTKQLWPQWILAATAIVASLGGIISLMLLKSSLVATQIAAYAAKQSTEIAVKQLEISQRPWIGITEAVIATPLVVSPIKSEISIRFMLKNSGVSIANKVNISGHTVLGGSTAAIKNEELWCRTWKPQSSAGVGYLMLPGEIKTRTTGFTFEGPKIEIDEAGLTQMWLSGCIFYFDQLEKLHRTPFRYILVTNDGKGAFRPSGTIHGTLKEFPAATAAD